MSDVYDILKVEGCDLHLLDGKSCGYGECQIISFIWVPKEKRGQGLGKKLLDKAKQLGMPLMLDPVPVDKTAPEITKDWLIKFYESQGFKKTSGGQ